MKQKRKVICFADKCVCVEEIRLAKEFDDKERGMSECFIRFTIFIF